MIGRHWRLLGPAWALPAALYLMVAFVAPLASNMLGAGAGLGAYRRLLTDPYYLGILAETLWVSLATTILCLLVGYPVAYFMVRYAGRWRRAILFMLLSPLLVTTVMRTFGWRALLARRGLLAAALPFLGIDGRPPDLLDQPVAVYLGLVHVMAPFAVMSIAAVLQGDRCPT